MFSLIKKIIFCLFTVFVLPSFAQEDLYFEPDFSLITTYEDADAGAKKLKPPFIAVYKKNGKMFLYFADGFLLEEGSVMAEYIFKTYAPNIIILPGSCEGGYLRSKCFSFEYRDNKCNYISSLAIDSGAAVTYLDLQPWYINQILRNKSPEDRKLYQAVTMLLNGQLYEKETGNRTTAQREFDKYLSLLTEEQEPHITTDEFEVWFKDNFGRDFNETSLHNDDGIPVYSDHLAVKKYLSDEDLYVRGPFILDNIAAALNKYNVVVAYNTANYVLQYKALEKMLGKPEFIFKVDAKKENLNLCPEGPVRVEVLIDDFRADYFKNCRR